MRLGNGEKLQRRIGRTTGVRLPGLQHRHVEPLRLRLPCFVMLDLCQQEIEPLTRRPFLPGTLARREATQGRDLLVGWRGRLPGRYVSPPNREVRDSDPLGPR